MFQFTTTHVINQNLDSSGKSTIEVIDGEVLQIKGVNNFKKDNIVSIYKAPYTEPEKAVATFSLDGLADDGDTLRLSLYIRLTSADNSSYYANETQHKGRPFTIEFPYIEDGKKTAANLEKIIKKYGLFVFEKELVKVSTNGNVITLTAINEFQRFHSIKIEKFVESVNPMADNWELISSVDNGITVDPKGTEGFGTYGWILRNLKLPTHEHTRAFAPKVNEMPIPGAKYDQYTIHYCANRGPLGLNAVGQDVKSATTHVLYVNQNVDFDAILEDLGVSFSGDGKVLEAENINIED